MALLALGTMGAKSCGGDVSNTPDNGAQGSKSAPKHVAHIGDTITLQGNSDGEKLSVTAVRIVDPVRSTNEFEKPDPGKRYVAVRFRVVDIGTAAYDDSATNGAKAIDAQGQNFDPDFITDLNVGATLDNFKLTPGSKALGYIVFQIPKGDKVAKVQFGLDSGFGGTGEWVA